MVLFLPRFLCLWCSRLVSDVGIVFDASGDRVGVGLAVLLLCHVVVCVWACQPSAGGAVLWFVARLAVPEGQCPGFQSLGTASCGGDAAGK